MPIVPAQSSGIEYTGVIPLPRYAQLVDYSDCAFHGVSHPGNTNYGCRKIWSLSQRREIAKYLMQAEGLIAEVVGYPLQPTYITGTVQSGSPDMYTDNQRLRNPLVARWVNVIEAGIKAISDVQLNAAVDHTADPAVVGPIATTVTDVDEIHVYLHGTAFEVIPSSIVIAGGNVTIEIPRCRLVAEAYLDNPEAGWEYSDISHFAAVVDVKRIYTDPSTQAVLLRRADCTDAEICSAETQTGCIYIEKPSIGRLQVYGANYGSGVWTKTFSYCKEYDWVQLNYLAGLVTLPHDIEDAIIRLAHALMPGEPCGCQALQVLWKRDRRIPDVLTAERLNCPFGQNDGAWFAYCVAINHVAGRGVTI